MGRARGGPQAAFGVGRGRRWSAELLEDALRRFLGQRRDWPTVEEFEAAGEGALIWTVKRRGGSAYWADRLGFELGPGQDRTEYTPADALRDARALVSELGFLPGDKWLRKHGHNRLASHIVRSEGRYSGFRARHHLPGPAR